jgi:anti-anti-sigma factor
MSGLIDRYRAAFDCVPHAILVIAGGQVVACNQAASALFGGEATVMHRNVEELLDVQGGLAKPIARALAGAREPVLARTRQTWPPLRLHGALGRLHVAAGLESALVLSLHEEADAPREAEERVSEERLQAMLASAPGWILTTTLDGFVTSINRAPPGVPLSAVLGMPVGGFTSAEHASRYADALLAVQEGKTVHFESLGPSPEGSATRWFALSAGPLRREGEIAGAVFFVVDIHEQKRLEAELARRAEELANTNRELAREIEERQATEATMRSLSTPIIRVWKDVLALPVIGAVDHARATQMMERLLEEIVRSEAETAVLDLTGVERVDQETGRYLVDIAKAVRLLGSRCFLSGISPAVARTMVEFGADVTEMQTFAELEDALRRAIRGEARS